MAFAGSCHVGQGRMAAWIGAPPGVTGEAMPDLWQEEVYAAAMSAAEAAADAFLRSRSVGPSLQQPSATERHRRLQLMQLQQLGVASAFDPLGTQYEEPQSFAEQQQQQQWLGMQGGAGARSAYAGGKSPFSATPWYGEVYGPPGPAYAPGVMADPLQAWLMNSAAVGGGGGEVWGPPTGLGSILGSSSGGGEQPPGLLGSIGWGSAGDAVYRQEGLGAPGGLLNMPYSSTAPGMPLSPPAVQQLPVSSSRSTSGGTPAGTAMSMPAVPFRSPPQYSQQQQQQQQQQPEAAGVQVYAPKPRPPSSGQGLGAGLLSSASSSGVPPDAEVVHTGDVTLQDGAALPLPAVGSGDSTRWVIPAAWPSLAAFMLAPSPTGPYHAHTLFNPPMAPLQFEHLPLYASGLVAPACPASST
jgi:hypothetical protein